MAHYAVKVKSIRPNTNILWYSTDILNETWSKYNESGDVVAVFETLKNNGLILERTAVFKNENSYNKYMEEPLVTLYLVKRNEYYTDNSIEFSVEKYVIENLNKVEGTRLFGPTVRSPFK